MHDRIVVSYCLILVTALAVGPAATQVHVSSFPSVDATEVNVTCPPKMLVVGATSRSVTPSLIRCSAYDGEARRTGSIVSVGTAGPTDPLSRVFRDVQFPLVNVDCPGDKAVTSFGLHVENGFVDYISVRCAGPTVSGGTTSGVTAGSFPSQPASAITNVLACPVTKFANGFIANDRAMTLVCVDAPIPVVTSIASLALSDFHTVGGNAVRGTVTLNAPATTSTAVTLSPVNVPGVVIPRTLDVPAGARSATFQIQSATNAATCTTIMATFGQSSASAPLIITPAPPSGAPFSFVLIPESQSLTFAAPSTMTAAVVLPPRTGTILGRTSQATTSPVTFTSDRPAVLSIQSATQRTVGDTVKVNVSALATGCAVLTATVDGVTWRKTLRIASGF